MNYILGGGVAGLLAAFYNPECKVIDLNPMGQLNLPFIPGPRILKRDKYAETFLDMLGLEYHVEKVKIGYVDEENYKIPTLTEHFKREYSKITRGTTKIEKSFLSGGESEFEILTDGSEDFYFKVFKHLHQLVEAKIILAKVTNIDLRNQIVSIIHSDGSVKNLPYHELISTLPLKVFLSLAGYPETLFNFETKAKHFIQCNYSCDAQKLSYIDTDYTYSINGQWTRRTHFKDYIVYEMSEKWYAEYTKDKKIGQSTDIKVKEIDGCPVLKVQLNVPIQIQNSIDIQNIANVQLLGRFAQWNHKIKANEILKTLHNWYAN